MQPRTQLLATTPTASAHGYSADETVALSRYPIDFLLWHRNIYPGLTAALLYWRDVRQTAENALPVLAEFAPLLAAPVGDFINVIDVSADDPMAYRLRRSARAQRIRQIFRDDYVTLSTLPPLYRDYQLMSIFSAKGTAQPSFRSIQRTYGDDLSAPKQSEDYVSLLLPCVTSPAVRKPDVILSVFDWLDHPESPPGQRIDRRVVAFRKAGRNHL